MISFTRFTTCSQIVVAWEDELKDSQKIFLKDDDDMLPEPAPQVLSSSSQPPASQKRHRSPDPHSYQDLDYPSQATGSHPSQGSSRGTRQTKTPRVSNASDVHSGSQRALNADGYLIPPSTLSGYAGIYTQPPASPESPSRKGKEQAGPASMSQAMMPESSQSLDAFFEEKIDGLKVLMKAALQRSERRRIAAERSAESKMKRIKQLEAEIEVYASFSAYPVLFTNIH
jgi:hypothetical protein